MLRDGTTYTSLRAHTDYGRLTLGGTPGIEGLAVRPVREPLPDSLEARAWLFQRVRRLVSVVLSCVELIALWRRSGSGNWGPPCAYSDHVVRIMALDLMRTDRLRTWPGELFAYFWVRRQGWA